METIEQKAFRYLHRCVEEYVVDLKSKKIIGGLHIYELTTSIVTLAIAEEREACISSDGITESSMQFGADMVKKYSRACQELKRECDDADRIITALGMTVDHARTEGGSLHVSRILERISEITKPKDEVTND